jgi:hypothetical protein
MARKIGTASDFDALTKSDATVYPKPYGALYVGTGGDVSLVSPKGKTAVFKNVPNGGYVRAQFVKVLAATTAGDLVGLFVD